MKNHIQAHKDKAEKVPHYCDICGSVCHSRENIARHMRKTHLKINRHNCKYCEKSYSDSGALKFHISYTHTRVFSYICEICGKGFDTKSRLETHSAAHTGAF